MESSIYLSGSIKNKNLEWMKYSTLDLLKENIMLIKSKNNKFAIKFINLIVSEFDNTWEISTPSIAFFRLTKTIAFEIKFFIFSIDIWFGDVKELI